MQVNNEADQSRSELRDLVNELEKRHQDNGDLIQILKICLELWYAWKRLGAPDGSALKWLYGIVANIEDFPLGEERKHWNPKKLKEQDTKLLDWFSGLHDELPEVILMLRRDIDNW